MKKRLLLCATLIGMFCVSACNDEYTEFDDHGSTTLVSMEAPQKAYMGDSLNVSYNVKSSGAKVNQAKIQLYYGDNLVSENIYSISKDGNHLGRVAVPMLDHVKDGKARIVVRVQNERFVADSKTVEIDVQRPVFQKLTLVGTDGTRYEMLPTATPYEYKVSAPFPAEMLATIEAEKYGENGNAMVFGQVSGKITRGATDPIKFEGEHDSNGNYDITFNTYTFNGTPFIKFGVYFKDRINEDGEEEIATFAGSGDTYKVETEFRQGEDIQISGLKADYVNYWINPSFFSVVTGTDGKVLRFMGKDGKYRFTVNQSLKYFNMEIMQGGEVAVSETAANANAMYVIGGSIGFPHMNTNAINYAAEKAQILCPMGNGVHRLVLQEGVNFSAMSAAWGLNMKFLYQPSWDFGYNDGDITVVEGAGIFTPAQQGMFGGGAINSGKYYEILLDTSKTPCQMRVIPIASRPEVAQK